MCSILGNPTPAHGGRTCVGSDRAEMYCSNLPPCPEPREQIDGGWGPWGQWSKCTSSCGGGFRLRRRHCDNPTALNGGVECTGCNVDFEVCNIQKCTERQVSGSWTPWFQQNDFSTNDDKNFEKRIRYGCKFNGTDGKVFKAKEEKRICFSNHTCHRLDDENDEIEHNDHSLWSVCTSNCGSGQQYRYEGSKKISRPCNTHPCKGLR